MGARLARLGLGLLLSVVASAGGALGAARDGTPPAAELARLEAYLNDLTTLRSGFVQIDPDGGMATGELYFARPGRMRLDYDPPADLLIVADGWGQLIYHDRRLEQTSHLFASSTPLGFLLEDEIRLDGEVTVTAFERVGDELLVTLAQTAEPEQGSVTLVFADQPLALRRWNVVDAQGLTTHVILEQVETDVPLADELFRFRDPQFHPGARN